MKVVQLYDKLDRHGGAQVVLSQVYSHLLANGFDSLVAGGVSYEEVVSKDVFPEERYFQFRIFSVSDFSGTIVFSHSRKMTTKLIFFTKLLNVDCKIIHVAHSIFLDKKYLTFFPPQIVAVSNAVKYNLVGYFGVNEKRIKVIYNGVRDTVGSVTLPKYQPETETRILYAARIEPVKQQVEMVQRLAGKIGANIKIDFAGHGSDEDILKNEIAKIGPSNFKYIGHQDNIPSLLEQYHYALLFSKKEGLGLSLVEACMAGRCLITRGNNGCEACAEVCHDQVNGFIVESWQSLRDRLNSLETVSKNDFYTMCHNSRKIYQNYFLEETMLDSYLQLVTRSLG